MNVKFKKLHPNAVTPSYAKMGDAGMDLTAVSVNNNNPLYTEYNTGLAFEIPIGYVGLLFPRSSCSNKAQVLSNCVGVVDSGYRGPVGFRFKITETYNNVIRTEDLFYKAGDRIGQLIIMPIPTIHLEEVEELTDTVRGAGGYGSTGS